MHAFLVSQIPKDLPLSPDVYHLMPEKSIGIEEVRSLQAFLIRKPLQLPENIAIIHQAEKLTLPAQHALLKTLEEPPGNSRIYLVTSFPDQLLETIISRCQLEKNELKTDSDNHDAYPETLPEFITKLQKAEIGERLELIDSQNFTRDSALEFLSHLEYYLHQNLDLKISYQLIVDTRKYLKSNCSVRLSMDNFSLNL
ncbi:hypothetical protein A2397_03925 [Candidatus Amesbacteria bacterium RIFOXYB1_FULL_44_23]|uniref:DNA polymerase III subunit delta n=1 Tax=Candidatus Amesbacteria bacterium RIFOXYB1_FULL_44_23 TaxID=1797263 RepID=A0A1F4ZY97_9BACT|nr:MAG: hypothetical protein A2397_03925 [Candidatus Amesbacteria bacterium RIFOXYB1_FULL_44_23]